LAITTIKLKPQTRDRLKNNLKLNQTYDDFINNLLNCYFDRFEDFRFLGNYKKPLRKNVYDYP